MSKQALNQLKHTPQRTCVVCRETTTKRTLTRVVRTPENGVQIDPSGKKNGRGAYLCDKLTCWQRAAETDVLEKALRTTLTDDDRQRIRTADHTVRADRAPDMPQAAQR